MSAVVLFRIARHHDGVAPRVRFSRARPGILALASRVRVSAGASDAVGPPALRSSSRQRCSSLSPHVFRSVAIGPPSLRSSSRRRCSSLSHLGTLALHARNYRSLHANHGCSRPPLIYCADGVHWFLWPLVDVAMRGRLAAVVVVVTLALRLHSAIAPFHVGASLLCRARATRTELSLFGYLSRLLKVAAHLLRQ